MKATNLGIGLITAGAARYRPSRSLMLLIVVPLFCVGCGSTEQDSEASERREVSSLAGVTIGTPADSVLEWRGRAIASVQQGSDSRGLLVEWRYPDGSYLMGRRQHDGITAYRVIAIYAGDSASAMESTADSTTCGGTVHARDSAKTVHTFLSSCLALKYALQAGEGWPLRDGAFNQSILTPTLEGAMLGLTTRGSQVVGAGVLFIGTSSLDVRQTVFVLDLVAWLSPTAAQDSLLVQRLQNSLRKRVPQVREATPFKSGSLLIHAANVGGDATVSIKNADD